MLDTLRFEDFEKLVKTKFNVNGYDVEIELELFEVSERKITPQQEMFSVYWRGPQDKLLQQGIYSLGNDQFTDATIFIVPISQNDEGITYQSAFNRIVKT